MKKSTLLAVALAVGLMAFSVGAGPAAATDDGDKASASPDCIVDPSGPYLLPCSVCWDLDSPPFKQCPPE
jgi:hypothetical protein